MKSASKSLGWIVNHVIVFVALVAIPISGCQTSGRVGSSSSAKDTGPIAPLPSEANANPTGSSAQAQGGGYFVFLNQSGNGMECGGNLSYELMGLRELGAETGRLGHHNGNTLLHWQDREEAINGSNQTREGCFYTTGWGEYDLLN